MREAVEGSAMPSWRAMLEGGLVAGLEDGPLLERFAEPGGDAAEVAFAAIVARHGPMVRRVCRKLLADPHDADDAFQATFLVLARKARTIRNPERLANWLYGTAHRASRHLRADLARRRKHELARSSPSPGGDSDRLEGAAIVLEEVAGLPGDCRGAVVLCDLEGLTQEEAARRLGCSDRTLRRRLSRAHDLLRFRLTRRGLAPSGAILAVGSDPIPGALIDATARLAPGFASGQGPAGVVPASALILAEGVLKAMNWAKIQGIAAGLAGLLVLGGGVASAFAFARAGAPKGEIRVDDVRPSPADRYRALVKKYDDAVKATQDAAAAETTDAGRMAVYQRLGPYPNDHLPAFVALAEEFPADPAAVDALFWVLERSLSGAGASHEPAGRAVSRAMEVIARDHAADPRIGEFCPKLTLTSSPAKADFLREIASKSPDRVAKGRATLALAQYLRMEAATAEVLQRPDAPIRVDDLVPIGWPDDIRKVVGGDATLIRRQFEEGYAKNAPDELAAFRRIDIDATRLEADRGLDRVLAEFGDVPFSRPYGPPTRETLADVVRQIRGSARSIPVSARFRPLSEAFEVAERKANEASAAAGEGEPGFRAYLAAAPKWADFGPKMWAIAEAAPRSPDGLDALLWIVRHHMPFFDSGEDRAATLGRAVDLLALESLEYLGDYLNDSKISRAFNHWSPIPSPHVDRIFRALSERGKTRDIRGRMGLALARHRKAEADLVESLEVRGADPSIRPEVAMFEAAYLAQIRKVGRAKLAETASTLFEEVKAEYGDVPYVNGTVPTKETLATICDRELAELRTLAIGQIAPEIVGKDVEGRSMSLSEFRGKVVVLDFGSHEHCGGCQVVYPKLRGLVEANQGRPFAVLGINTGDRLATLKELAVKKEVTWRCWPDGEDADGSGPISDRWNIKGYPTFIILDHRGVIRFKDLHPFDPTFGPAIEALLKVAEADRR